jgi:hypothetical protein
MKVALSLLGVCLVVSPLNVYGENSAIDLGFRKDTQVIQTEDDAFCPATSFRRNDDGSFENGYVWAGPACIPPDYGAWAEGYTAEFVCGIQFVLTQLGSHEDETMDVYVWESDMDGNPPSGPDPGNVLCVLPGVSPDSIALWPEFSTYNVCVCCETDGDHFVGFWGDWPGEVEKVWFIAADEDGFGSGLPRTKLVPGLGYPTGWNHPNIIPVFGECKDLGIRIFAGPGDCQTSSVPDRGSDDPDAGVRTTWGQIKAIY